MSRRRPIRFITPGSIAGVLLALLTLPTACGGRAPRPAEATAPKGRTIAITDSTIRHGGTDTVRFGHLGSGEIAVQRLRIENKTQKPVVILSVRRSCGCTSLDIDRQPLAPGESRKMEITFDSRGEYGWQLKNLDLVLAGAPKPLRLLIEADVD